MTRKQEGTRQIQKPRQGQGQKGQEQNINISLSVCFSCSSLFYRTSRETNREVKSGEGGGVLECRYMTIQFITRHKKKKGKASQRTSPFPFFNRHQASGIRHQASSSTRKHQSKCCAIHAKIPFGKTKKNCYGAIELLKTIFLQQIPWISFECFRSRNIYNRSLLSRSV